MGLLSAHKKKVWFSVFGFFCSLLIIAQNGNEELAKQYQKLYEKSPVILLNSEVTFEFRLDAKTHTPYLIENEDLQYMSLRLTTEISKFKGYDNESSIIQSVASNENKKKVPLNPICGNFEIDNIFYSDAKVCKYPLKFSYLGQIQNLTIQKRYNDLKYFTSVYFNETYPVHVRKIRFIIPEWLTVELKEMNFAGYTIQRKKTEDTKSKATVYEFTAENLDEMKHERFDRGNSFTYPHILVLSKSFIDNSKQVPLIGSVDDLYKWYISLVHQVQNDPKPIESTVKQLIAGKTTEVEKIKAIYYWVQDNIRYIAFEDGIAGFKPETAQQVFQNKYGDCKGMANLTKAMLQIAGYDARLTWIGTNKIAYDYSLPTMAVDNHMICTLLWQDKKYFLDATEKFIAFQDNAERIQGRQVLIENGDKYLLERVPEFSKDRNLVKTQQVIRLDGTSLIGNCVTEFNGEMKTGIQNLLHESSSSQKSTTLEKVMSQGDKNITIQKLDHSNLTIRETPLKVTYDFVARNQVSSFDNELYVNLDLDQLYADFIIKPERVSEVSFDEKVLRSSAVRFQIPTGYKLTHLPASLEKKHGAFSFKLRFLEKDGEIYYEKELSIDKGIIHKQDFTAWNDSVKELKKVYNDKIVFTKL
ncbi:transglutaminase domain-containing protein [Cytophagaceae bacterium YF14B1]|uniref:Transglutaminase domain-containing protein n=1 Tax=Xanthocytophaga flava TaxID=3048013 RepID=A0AAE3QVI2_9BACT|nr:transglutaminase domain-containing protein [Xanthocytophaga flavus]MDJ1484168.1 transglutaminase domain-containing protein [Xanthocytophaga flavus]